MSASTARLRLVARDGEALVETTIPAITYQRLLDAADSVNASASDVLRAALSQYLVRHRGSR